MKRLVTLTVLALLIGLTGYQATAASERSAPTAQPRVGDERGAAAFPVGTWNTGIQVQNPTSSTATVQVKFYDSTGALKYTTGAAGSGEPSTIAPGGSVTFYLPNVAGLADGKYSGVVESDQAVVAVVNETNYTGKKIADAYNGISQGATSLSLPLIFRSFNSWDSMVAVQNTSSSAAGVYLNFYKAGQATPTFTLSNDQIAGLASKTYDISSSTFSSLGSAFLGSMTITSTASVAAVAHSAKQTDSYDVLSIYRGFSSGATKFSAPLVFNQFSGSSDTNAWTTGIQVQNMGSTADTVTMTFTPTNGSGSYTVPKTIAANSSDTFFLPSVTPAIPAGLYGSAIIQSTSAQIAVIVNTTRYSTGVANAYNAFVDGVATTKVVAPLVYNQFGPTGDTAAWTTGIQVQNTGSSADTVTMTFTPTNSTGTYTVQKTIPANSSETFFLPSVSTTSGTAIPKGLYGSAVVQATSQKIVAVVNTTKYADNIATTYVGVNQN